MDRENSAEQVNWRCDWRDHSDMFYYKVMARGKAIRKEKEESVSNIGCQTEEIPTHVDWVKDKFFDGFVPEIGVNLFEDDEDLDLTHRWRSVAAREEDMTLTMVYTREWKKVSKGEGEAGRGDSDKWGGKAAGDAEQSKCDAQPRN